MEKYSRTELTVVVNHCEKKAQELTDYLRDNIMPQAIRTTLEKEVSELEQTKEVAVARRNRLVCKCTLCKKVYEVERATLGLICEECDDKLNKRMGK